MIRVTGRVGTQANWWIISAIGLAGEDAYEIGLAEDVSLHRDLDLVSARITAQVQALIKGVETEMVVMVLARRRARPGITGLAAPVLSLSRAESGLSSWRNPYGHRRGRRRYVEDNPMDEVAGRSIGILDYQRQ